MVVTGALVDQAAALEDQVDQVVVAIHTELLLVVLVQAVRVIVVQLLLESI